jgi:hypothetical protein
MSNYPEGLDSFTRKIDNQDTILANDVNELQEAVENVEAELGTDPAGSYTDVAERLDAIEEDIGAITIGDISVTLSSGNVGGHSTLDQHVKDADVHLSIDVVAYNYQKMLDRTLDQLQRGVLTSGYPLNHACTGVTTAFLLDAGDLAFCHTTSNPSSSGYDWHMVTTGGTTLASGTSLRLDDCVGYPTFQDASWITRLQFDGTYPASASSFDVGSGDLVFAHPIANPSTSTYSFFMATADASTSSGIRLNDEASAPTFTPGSRLSLFDPTATSLVDDDEMPIALGNVVFCHPTANPSASSYGFHEVTASSSGVSSGNLRLDGESSAPVFAGGSRFSKVVVTQSAPEDDGDMPIGQGDMAFCHTTDYPSTSSYGWHMVTTGTLGVSSSVLRLDDEDYAPVFPSGSLLTRRVSEKYQGVAIGGEILEIVHVPGWVILNSVGTGTDPGSTGTAPAVYGNLSVKMPASSDYQDKDFYGEPLELYGGGDPLASSALRPRVPAFSGHQDAYYPEAGMQVRLNATAAARGMKGAGILNRERFGDLCQENPTLKVFTQKLATSTPWSCHLPLLARVLDNNDNSQVDTGDFVVLVLTTQGESESPFVSTGDSNCNAVEIFKVPSQEPYTGTGEDGALVVDGTYASNSSNGIAHPGGQLAKPSNLQYELVASGGSFASGSSYYYRVSTVDAYGNETDATSELQASVTQDNSGIKLTWDSALGKAGYNVYRRVTGDGKYLVTVDAGEEFTDDNSLTPAPDVSYPTTNNTDGSYHVDSVKNFTSVTVQNGGVISCSPWNYDLQAYGRVVFYAKSSVLVGNSSKISATGKGYKGGSYSWPNSQQGESYTGEGGYSTSPNAGGGGAILGGGGYGTTGGSVTGFGQGGLTYGTASLDTLYRGSGGGGYLQGQLTGGRGGGIVNISANSITIQGNGSIEARGIGLDTSTIYGGSGSGGSIYLKANELNLGIGKVNAKGGTGDASHGAGGDGRVRFDYMERGASESYPAAYKHKLS